jgi:hypothetical protein
LLNWGLAADFEDALYSVSLLKCARGETPREGQKTLMTSEAKKKNGINVRKIDLGRKRRTERIRFGFNRFTLRVVK